MWIVSEQPVAWPPLDQLSDSGSITWMWWRVSWPLSWLWWGGFSKKAMLEKWGGDWPLKLWGGSRDCVCFIHPCISSEMIQCSIDVCWMNKHMHEARWNLLAGPLGFWILRELGKFQLPWGFTSFQTSHSYQQSCFWKVNILSHSQAG